MGHGNIGHVVATPAEGFFFNAPTLARLLSGHDGDCEVRFEVTELGHPEVLMLDCSPAHVARWEVE